MVRVLSACALAGLVALIAAPVWADPRPAGSAPPPPRASALTWTGVHAGGIGGFVVEPVKRTSTNTVSLSVTDSSFTAEGVFGGGRGGYTFRTHAGLIGFEADESFASMSGKFNAVNGSGATTSTTVNKTKSFGTARGIYRYSFGRAVLTIGGGVAWHSVTATRTQVAGQVNNATQGTVETLPVTGAGAALSAEVSKQLSGHLAFSVGYLYAHFSHTTQTPLSLISSVTSTPMHAIVAGITYFAK